MAKKTISNDDITQLKGPDRIRKKPGVMLGSDGIGAVVQTVFEIISNSIDEAKEGFGDLINITVFNDHSVQVEDFGRGIPLDFNNREMRYNWELIFCEMYAGGKYKNNEGGSYEYSIGTNGLGACATQYSSEYMTVKSYTGGYLYEIDFEKGFAVTELRKTELSRKEKRTGTIIKWRPDIEVFTDIILDKDVLTDIIKRQSVVNEGITFNLIWQAQDGSYTSESFMYENGIRDYITELTGSDAIIQPVYWRSEGSGKDREDKPEYKVKFELAFAFTKSTSDLQFYHNSGYLENGGSPEKAVRAAFSFAIDKYAKSVNKTKNDVKIPYADIVDSLVIVVNSASTYAAYENQTKKSVTNKFIYEFINNYIRRNLEIYFAENPAAADLILKQILLNKRSREAAEAARIDIGKTLAPIQDMGSKVEKFVDCRSRSPMERELYIVEGDSALTVCKLSRSAEFQAIMPVRGKTLNCLKSTDVKILKSQIIVDLLRVIGCGAEISGTKKGKGDFDPDKLRFNKIIICTDADEDGFQIRTLILTIFYRLLPSLITDGRIYIAESPLYEIRCGDNIQFAYDENEKTEILKSLGNKKYTIMRSKGLGENQPDMMKKTTMSPATRRLIRVCPADAEATYTMFDTLLGENIEARKRFISENGSVYMKDIDV